MITPDPCATTARHQRRLDGWPFGAADALSLAARSTDSGTLSDFMHRAFVHGLRGDVSRVSRCETHRKAKAAFPASADWGAAGPTAIEFVAMLAPSDAPGDVPWAHGSGGKTGPRAAPSSTLQPPDPPLRAGDRNACGRRSPPGATVVPLMPERV